MEILSCGTCLDYYRLSDSLSVGKVCNMYDIVELLCGENRSRSFKSALILLGNWGNHRPRSGEQASKRRAGAELKAMRQLLSKSWRPITPRSSRGSVPLQSRTSASPAKRSSSLPRSGLYFLHKDILSGHNGQESIAPGAVEIPDDQYPFYARKPSSFTSLPGIYREISPYGQKAGKSNAPADREQ